MKYTSLDAHTYINLWCKFIYTYIRLKTSSSVLPFDLLQATAQSPAGEIRSRFFAEPNCLKQKPKKPQKLLTTLLRSFTSPQDLPSLLLWARLVDRALQALQVPLSLPPTHYGSYALLPLNNQMTSMSPMDPKGWLLLNLCHGLVFHLSLGLFFHLLFFCLLLVPCFQLVPLHGHSVAMETMATLSFTSAFPSASLSALKTFYHSHPFAHAFPKIWDMDRKLRNNSSQERPGRRLRPFLLLRLLQP